jgi:hypothetical protein
MAGFVQIIELKTSHPDELNALAAEFRAERSASNEPMPVSRGTFTADRDRPGYYINIVEFDSYEAAMANNDRPETTKFAARLAELCEGPPKFYNLDTVDVWTR